VKLALALLVLAVPVVARGRRAGPLAGEMPSRVTSVILGVMKTAIALPDPLLEAADRLAKRLGISRSELVRRALALMLARHEGADVTVALDEIYGRPDVPKRLDPVLLHMQLGSLPKEDW
jgi:hypothetical protein